MLLWGPGGEAYEKYRGFMVGQGTESEKGLFEGLMQ
jgi:hypothetical protein